MASEWWWASCGADMEQRDLQASCQGHAMDKVTNMEIQESPKKSGEVWGANRCRVRGSSKVESGSPERDEVERQGWS